MAANAACCLRSRCYALPIAARKSCRLTASTLGLALQVLVQAGAELSCATLDGKRARDQAAESGMAEVLKVLDAVTTSAAERRSAWQAATPAASKAGRRRGSILDSMARRKSKVRTATPVEATTPTQGARRGSILNVMVRRLSTPTQTGGADHSDGTAAENRKSAPAESWWTSWTSGRRASRTSNEGAATASTQLFSREVTA